MATYVIGDIHACFDELQALLAKINFKANKDTLWFTGDFINGGPKPVETLRFLSSLSPENICVLGNHDLTLLGIASGAIKNPSNHPNSFQQVLDAPDLDKLIEWLKKCPLLHYDKNFNVLLVHAGVAPQWSLQQALNLAEEISSILNTEKTTELFYNMYGNQPDTWHNDLSGWPRLRCIINYFTRLRFCTPDGKLDLNAKGPINSAPQGFMPWFEVPSRETKDLTILFGHWAALEGKSNHSKAIALDTGCMWGNKLTALRLNDHKFFQVPGPVP